MATCTFPGCGAQHYARGYCLAHYHQNRRGTQLHPIGDRCDRGPALEAVSVRVSTETAARVAKDRAGARDALEAWARRAQ